MSVSPLPRSRLRRVFAALGFASLLTAAPLVEASIWPSSHERVARAFASADDAERRGAAGKLLSLPPAMAAELAVQGLEDPDVDVRLLCVRAAIALRIGGLGDRVVGWLADNDARLRTAACELIEASPTSTSIAALGRVLSDSRAEVRRAAAAAMGTSGLPAAVEPLLGHLDDAEISVRLEVVRALARIGAARAVLPLVAKVQDTEAEVRRAAARALGDLGEERAVATLVLALQDTSLGVRLQALGALGKLRGEQAVSSIASVLGSGSAGGVLPPAPVREAALRALGQIGSPLAVKIVLDELEAEGVDDDGGAPARRALVLAGGGAVEALRAALEGAPSRSLASGAAVALGEIGARDALPTIVRAMERGALPMDAGFRALGALGDVAALPFALGHLDDPDQAVRSRAIEVAAKLLDPRDGDGRAVDPVLPRLQDPLAPLGERVALAGLLGRTGAARAAPALAALAKHAPSTLRLAAIEALGVVGAGTPEIDAVLLEALSDDSQDVRSSAATALARVGTGAAATELVRRLEVAAEQDRGAIGIALSGAMGRGSGLELAEAVRALLPRAPAAARDSLIEGMGRMQHDAARQLLAELAVAPDADDRRKAAEALGGQPGSEAILVGLLSDPDPRVRASAVWSLGRTGDATALSELTLLLADLDIAVASNAAAALGHVAARNGRGAEGRAALCGALADDRSYVRSNALVGLRFVVEAGLGVARCGDGAVRTLLERDPSWRARAAAADLLHAWQRAGSMVGAAAGGGDPRGAGADAAQDPNDEVLEARALRRCASEDRDASAAARCRAGRGPRPVGGDITVFVVPDGGTEPVARAPFALELADGSLRCGVADRRGALFEASAPQGTVRLALPAALAP